MGDGDEFDVKRSNLQSRALFDDPNWDFRRARLREATRLRQAGGKSRHVHGDAQTRPEFRQRPNMILVRMRDDKADEVLLRLLDKGEVRA